MKKYRLFPAICLVAALLLSACSQDEPTENSTALPEGEYPLQIGSVTLTAEVSEQPWTRVSENQANGMSSEFQPGDAIGVSLNGETATYTYDGSTWTSEAPLYWKDKQPATVTAWYPVDEEIDFTQQDEGLTYLLKAKGVEAGYDTPANLTFTHQLAKVRVVLEGDKANEVQTVTVRSHLTSPNNQGDLGSLTSTENKYVPMMEATYNGQRCWEANLRPGYLEADNTFEVAKEGGTPVRVRLENDVSITAGQVHTINISVNPVVPENAEVITDATGEISDEGDYVVRGSFGSSITITGGSPDIYLDKVNMDFSRNDQIITPISITNGANPIIHVVGSNNITAYSYNNLRMAGIYVDSQSSVTICGNSTDDVLTVTAGADGAAIGGYCSPDYIDYACGDITISNVTVYAYANGSNHFKYPPAIGSTGDACGKITITDAIVHAQGADEAPAIGAESSVPEITIKKSEIHAYRGSNADYIGRAGDYNYQGGQIQGNITSSTVYKYLYDDLYDTSTPEGVVEFDENGIGTEQSQ